MMKKKKIELEQLKVQSFVTLLKDGSHATAKGGRTGFFCGESVKMACLSQGAQICSDDSC